MLYRCLLGKKNPKSQSCPLKSQIVAGPTIILGVNSILLTMDSRCLMYKKINKQAFIQILITQYLRVCLVLENMPAMDNYLVVGILMVLFSFLFTFFTVPILFQYSSDHNNARIVLSVIWFMGLLISNGYYVSRISKIKLDYAIIYSGGILIANLILIALVWSRFSFPGYI